MVCQLPRRGNHVRVVIKLGRKKKKRKIPSQVLSVPVTGYEYGVEALTTILSFYVGRKKRFSTVCQCGEIIEKKARHDGHQTLYQSPFKAPSLILKRSSLHPDSFFFFFFFRFTHHMKRATPARETPLIYMIDKVVFFIYLSKKPNDYYICSASL